MGGLENGLPIDMIVRVSDDALPHHYPTHQGLEEPERSDSAVDVVGGPEERGMSDSEQSQHLLNILN